MYFWLSFFTEVVVSLTSLPDLIQIPVFLLTNERKKNSSLMGIVGLGILFFSRDFSF